MKFKKFRQKISSKQGSIVVSIFFIITLLFTACDNSDSEFASSKDNNDKAPEIPSSNHTGENRVFREPEDGIPPGMPKFKNLSEEEIKELMENRNITRPKWQRT